MGWCGQSPGFIEGSAADRALIIAEEKNMAAT